MCALYEWAWQADSVRGQWAVRRSRAQVIEIVIVTYCAYWLTSKGRKKGEGREAGEQALFSLGCETFWALSY